jgi:YD repeat-containing protein
MTHRIARITIASLGSALVVLAVSLGIVRAGQNTEVQTQNDVVGQTITRLSDGKWLVVGGIQPSGPSNAVVVVDGTNAGAPDARIVATLAQPRGWHAATVLSDGRVLLTGGTGADGKALDTAEIFDPQSGIVTSLPWRSSARAHHTATLLRDGTVLIAGGVSATGELDPRVEVFDPVTFEARNLEGMLVAARQNHSARLMPDGTVRFEGGTDSAQQPPIEIYNPQSQRSRRVDDADPHEASARAVYSSPSNSDTVSPEARIVIQFTKPLAVQSLQTAEVELKDESGRSIAARSVLAENGVLLFLIPARPLAAGQRHNLSLRRLFDTSGSWAPNVSLTFAVQEAAAAADELSEEWIPQPGQPWRAHRPASPWASLSPLRAVPGITALSGQVLLLNGHPLAGVTLKIGERTALTDNTGRFLVTDATSGQHTLVIDGRSASTQGRTYGVFLSQVQLKSSDTTVLPYTIWMPKIDTARAVRVNSPLGGDLVVTTPSIPGLELHIPKGSVIRDHEGRAASEISITPIPVDRTPFPFPSGFDVPVYFTIQPGGGFIDTPNSAWPAGARVVYPNFTGHRPQTEMQFWNYDPEERGWHVYGRGAVNSSGTQVVPKPGAVIYRFTGTMINVPGMDPPGDGPVPDNPSDGDPVDLETGLFVLNKTDLYVADVMPLSLRRTYRPNDTSSRAFGIGAIHPYAMFMWSAQQYQEADLILPDGGRVHYVRISSGTGFADAVFEHTTSPGPFYKSTIVYVGYPDFVWHLRLKDGTTYVFGDTNPLQAIRDRHGNQITITHANGQQGNVTKVTSPNGRFIEFTYDASNRVTQAKDNIGRTVGYQYDGSGRLWKVTDAAGGVTEYTYDTSHRMLTIKDPRNITYLTNQYDTNGRVTLQTQADSTTYQFAYTLNGSGRVTQTDVTDPRGYVTRTAFNASRYRSSRIEAYGTASARTTTWTRDTGTQRVTRVTDDLNRNTDFTYDSNGNVASVTKLAGTANALTTNYTYDSTFSQLASVTDPLTHATTFTRNSMGDVTTITDSLTHEATFTYNPAGQPITVTTPAGTTSFTYDVGDVASITNPLGRVTTRFSDAVGRLLRVTNPLGHRTTYEYDALNATTKIIDALGGETTFTYDGNRNLLTLTDARNNDYVYLQQHGPCGDADRPAYSPRNIHLRQQWKPIGSYGSEEPGHVVCVRSFESPDAGHVPRQLDDRLHI